MFIGRRAGVAGLGGSVRGMNVAFCESGGGGGADELVGTRGKEVGKSQWLG